ncbi:hypothetical protein TRVA0_008S00122 [Trichomonascus vanleenenianus]|uniref:uncharacterized protein n=1 Tax=Trichomonascus vanleenenianus TaxID=2268995 RepID=UPI003EC954E6
MKNDTRTADGALFSVLNFKSKIRAKYQANLSNIRQQEKIISLDENTAQAAIATASTSAPVNPPSSRTPRFSISSGTLTRESESDSNSDSDDVDTHEGSGKPRTGDPNKGVHGLKIKKVWMAYLNTLLALLRDEDASLGTMNRKTIHILAIDRLKADKSLAEEFGSIIAKINHRGIRRKYSSEFQKAKKSLNEVSSADKLPMHLQLVLEAEYGFHRVGESKKWTRDCNDEQQKRKSAETELPLAPEGPPSSKKPRIDDENSQEEEIPEKGVVKVHRVNPEMPHLSAVQDPTASASSFTLAVHQREGIFESFKRQEEALEELKKQVQRSEERIHTLLEIMKQQANHQDEAIASLVDGFKQQQVAQEETNKIIMDLTSEMNETMKKIVKNGNEKDL